MLPTMLDRHGGGREQRDVERHRQDGPRRELFPTRAPLRGSAGKLRAQGRFLADLGPIRQHKR